MADVDPRLASMDRFFDCFARRDLEALRSAISIDVRWWFPGHNPLSGPKEGIHEVVAFLDALDGCGFKSERLLAHAAEDHVVDVHRGFSTRGVGSFDTMWSRVWTFDADHKIDAVVTMCANQHAVDAFMWDNYNLAELPERLNRFRLATQAPPDLSTLYDQ